MTITLVATIIALVLIGLVLLKKKPETNAKFHPKRPLSEPEQILYWKLKTALPDHVVLPQIAFSRFLYTKGATSKENFRKFGSGRQKVADFLICNKSFYILAIVELDDSSHNPQRDDARDEILKEAGLKLFRWKVGQMPTENEIKKIIMGV